MTDLPVTARFALPLLVQAQAQKEITHNEALVLIDALLQASVEDGPLAAPPTAPEAGQCWIVGAPASGAWAGREAALAVWTAGGWRFAEPRPGMRVVRSRDGAWLRFAEGAWAEPGMIAAPAGGSMVDSEARTAIEALTTALKAHGMLI
jgi:hypothetical protein